MVTEGKDKGKIAANDIITEEVNISTMVEELEQLDYEEATRSRVARARARRVQDQPNQKITGTSRRIYKSKIGVQDYPLSKMFSTLEHGYNNKALCSSFAKNENLPS
ncbi:Uncharacterized protein Fot_41728 [Forsythia ovata]|uniref:Uncharacterized protein n=1 Tax=Forsythia ovata TaxID=205694 RepID=A0ABD1RJ36_9LAMI